jgi:hypothetical protein
MVLAYTPSEVQVINTLMNRKYIDGDKFERDRQRPERPATLLESPTMVRRDRASSPPRHHQQQPQSQPQQANRPRSCPPSAHRDRDRDRDRPPSRNHRQSSRDQSRVHVVPPLTEAEQRTKAVMELQRKKVLIYQLRMLKKFYKLSPHRKMTVADTVDDLQWEVEQLNKFVALAQNTNGMCKMFGGGCTMLVSLNRRLGKLLDIDDWDKHTKKIMDTTYRPILMRLYLQLFKSGGQLMSPGIELGLTVLLSLATYHMNGGAPDEGDASVHGAGGRQSTVPEDFDEEFNDVEVDADDMPTGDVSGGGNVAPTQGMPGMPGMSGMPGMPGMPGTPGMGGSMGGVMSMLGGLM